MKTFRSKRGPFIEQTYYKDSEIEAMCLDELTKVGMLPAQPEPIRIDRFIEKRFGVSPSYEGLGDGILGFTKFGPKGVREVVVARALEDEGTQSAERRIRSTLAHEAGHGLFHAHLFVLEQNTRPLFGDYSDPAGPKVLCRDIPIGGGESSSRYDGKWWEFQANRAIGSLLIPKPLLNMAIVQFLMAQGLGQSLVRRSEAVETLATIFDVNPVVARIRLDGLYPQGNERQLTL
jgi:hypothetical protein